MKIKTKIRLGLIFLLAIIITLAATGSFYINKLADISSVTLKNNYETLEYTKSMIQALDEPNATGEIKFEENLRLQENNITEEGEDDATQDLRTIFNLYKSGKRDEITKSELRKEILHIQELNMNAIVRKNADASAATKSVFAYITILGTLCFLLSFTFVINFPGMIANPIAELTKGIKEIANKNYSQRLNFSSNDEFGEVANAFNKMAIRLDEFESSNLNELMFEKKRIETIINNMKDAIIGFDENNKILFANTIALQLLNVLEKDITGKYAPDIALHNDLLRNLLAKNENEKLLKIFADGKESYFTKDYLEISNKEKKIGEVIVLRNITRFQELDLAKTNFIATISHELKTPISSILMSLKLLNDERIGEANTEQKKLLQSINDDSERLLKITGELLNLTQAETGNIQLTLSPVTPGHIVEVAVEAVRSMAEQSRIQLQTAVPDNLPYVNADLDKTVWVLVNLLTNAVRYSPPLSTIQININDTEKQIQISVLDSGKGIAETYLNKVFERYFKVPGSKGGTGLGLAICKEFIEAQGGRIWVESKIGEGSKFSFVLNKARM
jgi:signal transduction histidine kinase